MAKIEMDISEYESMKENKVLLEKSLEKERALQKEIKKLTDEKVEALEAAQRKIVKVSKKEVTEHLVFKRNAYDINIHRSVARAVFNIISSKDRVGSAEIIELQKSLFEKVRSYSEPVEEITTHGLDDIKSELREDIKSKIEDRLEKANKAFSQNRKLVQDKHELCEKNDYLSKKVNRLLVDIKSKESEIETHSETLSKIRNLLKNGYGFWNKSKLLDQVISLVNKVKKK